MDSFLNPTGISTQMATPKMSQPESVNELSQEPKPRKKSLSVEPSLLGPANSNMPPPSPAVLAALGELYEEQQASSRKVAQSSTEAPSTAEKAPPSVRDCKLQLESNSSQIDSEAQDVARSDDTKDDMSRSSSQNPQGPESLRVNQVPPRLGMLTTEKLHLHDLYTPLMYNL